MKTYEEMAQSALKRIDQSEAERRQRRKNAAKITAPVASLCFLAVLGLGLWKMGAFRPEVLPADAGHSESDGSDYDTAERQPSGPAEEIAERDAAEEQSSGEGDIEPGVPPEGPEPDVMGEHEDGGLPSDPAKEATGGFAYLWWNRLNVSGQLYFAMEDEPDGVFEILAVYRPATANITSFTYEGKTLSELAIAADNERLLPEKMTQLLKLGDELKYGTALYETGTPDGERWGQSFYEEKIAYFGEELLSRYLADGEFLREKLEADLAALPTIDVTTPEGTVTVTENGETSARKQYALAYDAYLDTVLPAAVEKLAEAGISCERAEFRNDGLALSVTPEELKNLPLEDPAYWYFELAAGGSKDAAGVEPTADTAGLRVVN